MTTTVLNTKVSEFDDKFHDKCITTPEFNKLEAENFALSLKQANSVTKTDFDNTLISFNKRIISNKTTFLSLHYNSDNSYLFVNEQEIYTFKASDENANFPSQFCLEMLVLKA